MGVIRTAALVIVISACTSPDAPVQDSPPKPWTSGSRVRAKLFTADGFQTLEGAVDTETGDACAIVPTRPPRLPPCEDALSYHDHEGVAYGSYDTDDGFSAITVIDGEPELPIEPSDAQLQNRYLQVGSVKRVFSIYDASTEGDCAPHVVGGEVHCVPLRDDRQPAYSLGTNCSVQVMRVSTTPTILVSHSYDGSAVAFQCNRPITGTWSERYPGIHCRVFDATMYACDPYDLTNFPLLGEAVE